VAIVLDLPAGTIDVEDSEVVTAAGCAYAATASVAAAASPAAVATAVTITPIVLALHGALAKIRFGLSVLPPAPLTFYAPMGAAFYRAAARLSARLAASAKRRHMGKAMDGGVP
jgi:hypothetical protein